MIKSFVCGECPYNEKVNYVDKNNNIDIVYKNSEKLDSVQSKYQKKIQKLSTSSKLQKQILEERARDDVIKTLSSIIIIDSKDIILF